MKPNWIGRGALVARDLQLIAQAFLVVLLVLSDMADSNSLRLLRRACPNLPVLAPMPHLFQKERNFITSSTNGSKPGVTSCFLVLPQN